MPGARSTPLRALLAQKRAVNLDGQGGDVTGQNTDVGKVRLPVRHRVRHRLDGIPSQAWLQTKKSAFGQGVDQRRVGLVRTYTHLLVTQRLVH